MSYWMEPALFMFTREYEEPDYPGINAVWGWKILPSVCKGMIVKSGLIYDIFLCISRLIIIPKLYSIQTIVGNMWTVP